jgi:glycosyltransferase involved in cell wall biosynthesis
LCPRLAHEATARDHLTMTMRPTIVAIIATFNEADIIGSVVASLVADGISVYLLDDGSTDGTLDVAAPFLGRGLLAVEALPQDGTGFSLRRIIARKQELARELDFDWFINHDADEFRESPWPGVDLAEGIRRVDALGFNAIDFEVLDFVPTHEEFKPGDDPRVSFQFCVPSSSVNKLQIRCWKKTADNLELVSSAGHEAVFSGRQVFPIRFLLRHYPFRSQAHGERKLFGERRPRYDQSEREIGWHVQYESIGSGHLFARPLAELARFDGDRARLDLQVNNRILEEALTQRDELRARLASAVKENDALQAHAGALAATISRERAERDTARRHVSRLQTHVEELAATVSRERAERDTARGHLSHMQSHLDELDRELAASHQALREKNVGIGLISGYLEQSEAARTEAERQLREVHGSLSWRLTHPLRRAIGWVRKRANEPPNATGQSG